MNYKKHSFPNGVQDKNYQVFPLELENDRRVGFHGTDFESGRDILDNGFKIPENGPIKSISFSYSSSLALGYACNKRGAVSQESYIIAVKFSSLDLSEFENSVIHMYRDASQAEIIGYCVIPGDYCHV